MKPKPIQRKQVKNVKIPTLHNNDKSEIKQLSVKQKPQ